MFENIDALKKKLDQHRPLSPTIVKNLQEDLIVRWIYHSNAIEGNRNKSRFGRHNCWW
jgi:hypothetical protein